MKLRPKWTQPEWEEKPSMSEVERVSKERAARIRSVCPIFPGRKLGRNWGGMVGKQPDPEESSRRCP